MNGYFHDPHLTDITRIPEVMASLKSISFTVAWSMITLIFVIEIINQNVKSGKGASNYVETFTRLFFVVAGLIMYTTLFNFFIGASKTIEMAILSEKAWADLLAKISKLFISQKISIMSALPMVFAWIVSFLAIVIKEVIYWIRFALLGFLYFVGPIVFVIGIFEKTKFIIGAWFKNVIQLSVWSITIKVLVRVMLELQAGYYLDQANSSVDLLRLFAINTTFIVLLLFSARFTARFVNGDTIGSMAVIAGGYMATKGLAIGQGLKYLGGRVGSNGMGVAGEGVKRYSSSYLSKTQLRDELYRKK